MVSQECISLLYRIYFNTHEEDVEPTEIEKKSIISYLYSVSSRTEIYYLDGWTKTIEPFIIKRRISDAIPKDAAPQIIEYITDGLVGDQDYSNWRADRIFMPKKLALKTRKKLKTHLKSRYERRWWLKFGRLWKEFKTKLKVK